MFFFKVKNAGSQSRDGSRPVTPTSTSYFISHKCQLVGQTPKILNQVKDGSTEFSPTKFSIMKQSEGDMATPDLTNTSILDLPIIFADNDGNIEEEVVTTSEPSSIRFKPVNNPGIIKKSIVINRQGGKMVLINKGAMGKSLGNVNVIGRTGNLQKILVTNSNKLPNQTSKIITIPSSSVNNSASSSGKRVEIINNTLIKSATSSSSECF